MIFDSHAHYSRKNFDGEYGVWRFNGNGFSVERLTREGLFDAMRQAGIAGCIEPSVDMASIPTQLALAGKYPSFLYVAVGVHPTRCRLSRWKDRTLLDRYAREGNAVAVGETGLDYHYPRVKQHRFTQKRWFVYQIKLADRMGLPLVLHVREAHRAALKILKKYRDLLHGGVAHCFTGDVVIAREYAALGFAIGVGGILLDEDDRAAQLCRTVEQLPLTDILLETDAPYVSPAAAGEELSRKQWAKVRNSSLILPAVAEKVARLKGISREEAERVTTENVRRIFGIREI